MNVPHWLSHLRTDDRGRPVPYINRWGPEDVRRLSIREDPAVHGMPAFFDDDTYEPTPDFFAQNMQRECMAYGLCQVCGRPVPWSRRQLVVSSIAAQQVDIQGATAVALTEPWLDERCAAFATKVCPGLIRRSKADDLQLIDVTSKRQCVLTVSTGWVEGPLEGESRRVQPAMWAKVVRAPRPGHHAHAI